MTPEDELIERAQAGEPEAFCLLTRAYQRRIYALALHYTRHPQEAEDLSQEVWLKAYRAIGGYRREAGFYTWLRRITVNTFLNDRRGQGGIRMMFSGEKKAIRLGALVSLDEMGLTYQEPQQSPEARLQQQLMIDKVHQGLGELTAQQRLIFWLKHHEGMTYEEIAQACAVSTGTVKKSLFRALEKLRVYLGVKVDAPDDVAYAPQERR